MRRAILTAFLVLFLLPSPSGAQAAPAAVSVRYRSADTIYLDAGKAAGIDVGDRLQVLRGGQVIAEIEVIFAAERSASAKVLSERQSIQPGDRTRPSGEAGTPSPRPAAPAPATSEPPPVLRPEQTEEDTASYRMSQTRVGGILSFDWESFNDGSDEERGSESTTGRIHLRVRDIAGSPLQLRLRMRSREVSRDRELSGTAIGTIPDSESFDRLYEAALIYDEPDRRFAFRAGRLGTSPFVGLGYLDGALGEVRLGGFALGGLYGRLPALEELGFKSSGSKLGAFVRFEPRGAEGRGERSYGLLLAGIREEGDLGISREYATVESRFDSGRRWSFFQHAEVDFNTGFRQQLAAEESQISNLSFTALGRISERSRVVLTYDRFQPYLTEEDRSLPEDLVDRLWRQGVRVSWQTDREGGLHLSFQAGVRNRENGVIDPFYGRFDSRETYSLGLGVYHARIPGLGISAGLNALGYTSASAEGLLVTARAGRRLGEGHEIGLTVGGNVYRTALEEERTLAWGRASLWLELPLDLFGQAEVELLTGDEDLQGQRLRLGLGYRF